MTDQQVKSMLEATGIYFDPDHPDYIEADKLQELPLSFLEWWLDTVTLYADNVPYHTWRRLTVRVFWDVTTKRAVQTVQAALADHELGYTSEDEFLQELGFWQTTMTTEV